MPEKIGGKTFHGPEESDPLSPEDRAKAEAAFAEFNQRSAQVAPEDRVHLSDRFGDQDWEGTEFEEWASKRREQRPEQK